MFFCEDKEGVSYCLEYKNPLCCRYLCAAKGISLKNILVTYLGYSNWDVPIHPVYVCLLLLFQRFKDKPFQFICQFRIVGNALFGRIASLSEFGVIVAIPRAAFLDDT